MSSKENSPPSDQSEKKLKPCCACPETRQARDNWSATTMILSSALLIFLSLSCGVTAQTDGEDNSDRVIQWTIGEAMMYRAQQLACSGVTYRFSCPESNYTIRVGGGLYWGVMANVTGPLEGEQCAYNMDDCYVHHTEHIFIDHLLDECENETTCTFFVPSLPVDECGGDNSHYAFFLMNCYAITSGDGEFPPTNVSSGIVVAGSSPPTNFATDSANKAAHSANSKAILTNADHGLHATPRMQRQAASDGGTENPDSSHGVVDGQLISTVTIPYRDAKNDTIMYRVQAAYCSGTTYRFECDISDHVMWVAQGLYWGAKQSEVSGREACVPRKEDCKVHDMHHEFLKELHQRCDYRSSCWFTVPKFELTKCNKTTDWVFLLFECGVTVGEIRETVSFPPSGSFTPVPISNKTVTAQPPTPGSPTIGSSGTPVSGWTSVTPTVGTSPQTSTDSSSPHSGTHSPSPASEISTISSPTGEGDSTATPSNSDRNISDSVTGTNTGTSVSRGVTTAVTSTNNNGSGTSTISTSSISSDGSGVTVSSTSPSAPVVSVTSPRKTGQFTDPTSGSTIPPSSGSTAITSDSTSLSVSGGSSLTTAKTTPTSSPSSATTPAASAASTSPDGRTAGSSNVTNTGSTTRANGSNSPNSGSDATSNGGTRNSSFTSPLLGNGTSASSIQPSSSTGMKISATTSSSIPSDAGATGSVVEIMPTWGYVVIGALTLLCIVLVVIIAILCYYKAQNQSTTALSKLEGGDRRPLGRRRPSKYKQEVRKRKDNYNRPRAEKDFSRSGAGASNFEPLDDSEGPTNVSSLAAEGRMRGDVSLDVEAGPSSRHVDPDEISIETARSTGPMLNV